MSDIKNQERVDFIEKHGAVGEALLDYYSNLEDARIAMEENYSGCYDSVADYARDLTEDAGDIPSHLAGYIDYESMGRDLELGGEIIAIETGFAKVHIFWSH